MSLHTTQYQVIADRSRCCGYGLCAAVCPEIYKLDDDGIVYLTIDRVPPELEEGAREGAAAELDDTVAPQHGQGVRGGEDPDADGLVIGRAREAAVRQGRQ